ncbi:unnamed protein product [Sphagnum tenellum]
MGRIITSKYVMQMQGFNYYITPSAYHGKVPSAKKFERMVMGYVVSTMPGFVNEDIGKRYGISIPSYACIRENRLGGLVKVEYLAPMFQVLPDPKDYPEIARVDWVKNDQISEEDATEGPFAFSQIKLDNYHRI